MEFPVSKKKAEESYRVRAEDSLMTFLSGLTIDGADGPVEFRKVIAEFQEEVFDSIAEDVQAVAKGSRPERRRFWIERTKKAGKDSDLAIVLLWLLAFAKKPLYLQVGAADRDQANIVKKRMEALLYYNPWLQEKVEITRYKARGTSGLAELDIMAADIAGAHGGTPDVLVVNELSHVTKWEFVQNLLDNADGVPNGIVLIATNAGFIGTKAYALKEVVEKSKNWYRFYWTEPAPWIREEDVEEAKAREIGSRFQRLWKGRWVSGKGDALSEEAIARMFCLPGPLNGPEPGWQYIGGLDLGVSHDHAGFLVLGVNSEQQQLKVAWFRDWAPGVQTGEVDLPDVQETIQKAHGLFRMQWIGCDPNQAVLMIQQLRRRGLPMQKVVFSGKTLPEMADGLKQVVDQGVLKAYDDMNGTLRRDLGKLTIEEKPYGYRLTAVSDETGHADVGTALMITIPRAVKMMSMGGSLMPDEDVYTGEGATKEDIEEMPQELREIYEYGMEAGDDWDDDDERSARRAARERRKRRRKLPRTSGEGIDDAWWEMDL